MDLFPRTMVGGVSLPRLVIGTNWFLGCSHTSKAKDALIVRQMTRDRIADILEVFLNHGVDAVISGLPALIREASAEAEQRTGRRLIQIVTPHQFKIHPNDKAEAEPERAFDECKAAGATFCMPHQSITDRLLDRLNNKFHDLDRYTKMIRERGMVPGLSTHLPETVVIADRTGADVETYIQIYNAAGFMMPVEQDWAMRLISKARKPVMTIKPLAAGRLIPPVGLAFVWNTIRDQDMVVIGTNSPDEAREVIELSLDFLHRRLPSLELQKTRSKMSLTG